MLRVKGVTDEDFVNYKVPSMYICTSVCDFKCDAESGKPVCQNSGLAKAPDIVLDTDALLSRYVKNNITHAIVLGGLEPFDQFDEVLEFVQTARAVYNITDDIVIYTGYYPFEIENMLYALSIYNNIVVKFGRFIPDQEGVFDKTLGVRLASQNQYGERIS